MTPKERDCIAATPKKMEPKVKIKSFFQAFSSNFTSVKAGAVQRQPANQPSTVSRSSSRTLNSLDITNNRESFLEQKKEAIVSEFLSAFHITGNFISFEEVKKVEHFAKMHTGTSVDYNDYRKLLKNYSLIQKRSRNSILKEKLQLIEQTGKDLLKLLHRRHQLP